MYLLVLGLIMLLLKYLQVSPVATWSWWLVLAPFALAVLWWWFADASGYTQRKEAEREDQRKASRIEENRKRLELPRRPG